MSRHDTASHDPLPASLPPRGICRDAAAAYVGVSPSKFDEMVKDHRMPAPIHVDARRIWDRRALDRAFDALAAGADVDDTANEWDAV